MLCSLIYSSFMLLHIHNTNEKQQKFGSHLVLQLKTQIS